MKNKIKKYWKEHRVLFILSVIFGLLVICSGCAVISLVLTPVPTPSSQEVAIAMTMTSTSVPKTTDTPLPTNTPKPTNIPKPTKTSTPTSFPTPIPEPIVYKGNGDDVIDLQIPFSPAFVDVVGPIQQGNFIIFSYDVNDDKELLVNALDNYVGRRFLLIANETRRFEIMSNGEWEITILPFAKIYVHILDIPGIYHGSNDDIVMLRGNEPDLLEVKSIGESNFIIFAPSLSANRNILVTNEIAPFLGTYILPNDAFLLDVMATGEWTLTTK